MPERIVGVIWAFARLGISPGSAHHNPFYFGLAGSSGASLHALNLVALVHCRDLDLHGLSDALELPENAEPRV